MSTGSTRDVKDPRKMLFQSVSRFVFEMSEESGGARNFASLCARLSAVPFTPMVVMISELQRADGLSVNPRRREVHDLLRLEE